MPHEFEQRTVDGRPFQHRVFSRAHPSSGTLHVYIEGDGRAWLDTTTISRDPTPRDPLMLELMALDPGPSVYVGRPCYFGLARTAPCEPRYWTTHRYSARVVASLQHVIETLVAEGDYEGVALFGHSGGGTLATLLASRVRETQALVTIAPNLDVAAWTQLHGYSALSGSLDPARSAEFPAHIFKVHWIGGRDERVPASLVSRLKVKTDIGRLRRVEDFGHRCCWHEIWQDQLEDLDAYLASPPANRAGGEPAARNAPSEG